MKDVAKALGLWVALMLTLGLALLALKRATGG